MQEDSNNEAVKAAKSTTQANEEEATMKETLPIAEEHVGFRNWWNRRSVFEKEISLFVILPTIFTFGYYSLIASPMYISETQFAVKDVVEQGAGIDIATQIFKTSSSSVQNARIVEAYIQSPDIFKTLDKELKIIDHYSSSDYDFISRLAKNPSAWEIESLWSRVSDTKLNVDSGIVKFAVRAYDPKMAYNIARSTLRASEALVNEMNERSRNDSIKIASTEVKLAQKRVLKAQQAMQLFRDEHQELDPKITANGLQTLVFDLEGELSKVRAQLEEARAYMQANAPMILSLEGRIDAIEKQIKVEKSRIAGTESLNTWLSTYENLMLESEFAQKQLVSAMSALEQARAMALVKTQYIVPIQKPTFPDESRYPRIFVFTLCAFFGFFFLYGMVRLIIASIREHAGF